MRMTSFLIDMKACAPLGAQDMTGHPLSKVFSAGSSKVRSKQASLESNFTVTMAWVVRPVASNPNLDPRASLRRPANHLQTRPDRRLQKSSLRSVLHQLQHARAEAHHTQTMVTTLRGHPHPQAVVIE